MSVNCHTLTKKVHPQRVSLRKRSEIRRPTELQALLGVGMEFVSYRWSLCVIDGVFVMFLGTIWGFDNSRSTSAISGRFDTERSLALDFEREMASVRILIFASVLFLHCDRSGHLITSSSIIAWNKSGFSTSTRKSRFIPR
ncbi:hypothetical protein J6590_002576 [Homalodisca vitripennis]|nr:hypothetical protein J6590_002576 [Homalodisca vitripennis]